MKFIADIVSWDFGMCDAGPNEYKQNLYMARNGMHPNRPAFVGINIEDDRVPLMKSLEDKGLTTFYLHLEVANAMTAALPDMLGMNQKQIDEVPDFVRYFKCKDELEREEPGCNDHKYNEALCSDRPHKASWHPGWKYNALYGQIMAFFLLDHLQLAITELRDAGDYDPFVLLTTLEKAEDKDYEKFFKNNKIHRSPIGNFLAKDFVDNIDPDLVFHGPALCHTALTPSQIRYKGILTETDEVGLMGYYKGIKKDDADKQTSGDGKMRLVWERGDRGPDCPVLTKIDFKDFFYANELDNWTSVTIPNDAEIKEFGAFAPQGLIMMCFKLCDWGYCSEGELREKALQDGSLKMKVNGVPVTDFSQAAECFFIKHADGFLFKDDAQRFKIEVFLEPNSPGKKQHYIRITSIVIF